MCQKIHLAQQAINSQRERVGTLASELRRLEETGRQGKRSNKGLESGSDEQGNRVAGDSP
jgi:hypothetical protein